MRRDNQTPTGPADPRHKRQPSGCVLWTGQSRFDGGPTAVVLTWRSENVKTGDMAQATIIRTDTKPLDAHHRGLDGSVCGAGERRCVHAGIPTADKRGNPITRGASCYVNLGQSVGQIYRSFAAGHYPAATDGMLRRNLSGRSVRIGSYGDPCAVPVAVWKRVLRFAAGHTGYTQQWRWPDCQSYRSFLMASVHSESDLIEARDRGWRCFRVRMATDPVAPGEIVCPATPEGQYRRQCLTCLACDGADRPGKVDVVTIGHGSPPVLRSLRTNLEGARRGAEGIVWG